MGIRRLNKFLTTHNYVTEYHSLNEYTDVLKHNQNMPDKKIVIAVDFWLYVHKFLHSNKSDNIVMRFWKQIDNFLSCGIIPLYVIDGSVPIEKQHKIDVQDMKRINYQKRIATIDQMIEKYVNIDDIDNSSNDRCDITDLNEKKSKIQKNIKRINGNDQYNIFKLFSILGIPHVRATFEADAMCAKLFKHNIISGCLSDDTDMIALGCGSTIKFDNGRLIEYNLDRIINKLQLTQEQFIDMCILFGCDYLQHPLRLECDEIYEMIKKYGSLMKTLDGDNHPTFNMNNCNVKIIGENYYHVRDIFLHSHTKEIIPDELYDIELKPINVKKVIKFFKKNTNTKNLHRITESIGNFNDMIDRNIL
jgi:5'-3' exonuclease